MGAIITGEKKNRFLVEGKFEFIMKGHLDLFSFVEKLLCPQLLICGLPLEC